MPDAPHPFPDSILTKIKGEIRPNQKDFALHNLFLEESTSTEIISKYEERFTNRDSDSANDPIMAAGSSVAAGHNRFVENLQGINPNFTGNLPITFICEMHRKRNEVRHLKSSRLIRAERLKIAISAIDDFRFNSQCSSRDSDAITVWFSDLERDKQHLHESREAVLSRAFKQSLIKRNFIETFFKYWNQAAYNRPYFATWLHEHSDIFPTGNTTTPEASSVVIFLRRSGVPFGEAYGDRASRNDIMAYWMLLTYDLSELPINRRFILAARSIDQRLKKEYCATPFEPNCPGRSLNYNGNPVSFPEIIHPRFDHKPNHVWVVQGIDVEEARKNQCDCEAARRALMRDLNRGFSNCASLRSLSPDDHYCIGGRSNSCGCGGPCAPHN